MGFLRGMFINTGGVYQRRSHLREVLKFYERNYGRGLLRSKVVSTKVQSTRGAFCLGGRGGFYGHVF